MKNFLISIVLILFLAAPSFAAESESVDTGKVVASLVSSHDSAAPGETIQLALRTILDDKWHTYWSNPGDSGEPVQLDWVLKDGWSVSDITWPLPQTLPTGPIINYGFEGSPLFPVSLTIPVNAVVGEVETLRLNFYYLVCKDVCIPESGSASIDILIGETVLDERWSVLIQDAINTAPQPSSIKAAIKKEGSDIILTAQNLGEGDFSNAYFFPFDQGVLMHSEPQVVSLGTGGLQIKVSADYGWDNDMPNTLGGVLSFFRNGEYIGEQINLTVGEALNVGVTEIREVNSNGASITVLGAIIGALLGGLILNLMPCVFPVISIKALSIAKSAHGERAIIRREAWAYTAGVLATFLVLTLALLVLKAAGNEIGWGFQLQSPIVVGVLALLLFAVGLNLLGVFEFGSGLQNTGSELTHKGGLSGSFFTGLLAVIVATPCTAPFMAGAIGYALAQPAYVTIAVFMALAIGFALPFLLIAYVPGLLKALPKPGAWMVRFKEILAFPMFAAVIWLVWVLSIQSGETGVLIVLASMLLFGFGIWAFKIGSKLWKALGLLSLIAALFICFTLKVSTQSTTDLRKEAWSKEIVASLRAEGKPVFVDFTAAWCVTCKVNEKLVLEKEKTKALFEKYDVAFLVADWTNKNDVIAAELEGYGRAGVPLYLLFPPGDNFVKAEVLPQILTYDVLEDALKGTKL